MIAILGKDEKDQSGYTLCALSLFFMLRAIFDFALNKLAHSG